MFASIIVRHRKIIFAIMMLITIGSAFLVPRVNVNMDMSKYLPADSSMRQGIDIMDEEFPATASANTIRVMFTGLTDKQKQSIHSDLESIPYVSSVDSAAGSSGAAMGSASNSTTDSAVDSTYEKTVAGKTYNLYIVSTKYDFHTDEELSIEDAITAKYDGKHGMVMAIDMNGSELPLWIVGIALAVILMILFIMCPSFLEPFLFLGAIGCAVLINTGTNALMPSVSDITNSIAAILQLVLSMDYSIILMNRYRQEKATTANTAATAGPVTSVECMKNTLVKAFAPIASSAFTTIVGLMALAFMSYKIGADLGFVLAKGVFISMISILTILPFLILAFEKGIEKTAKPVIKLPTNKLGDLSYKFRHVAAPLFILMFALVFTMRGNTGIAYTLSDPSAIDNIFPKTNKIVVLYETADDKAIQQTIKSFEKNPKILSAVSYSNTVGKPYTPSELKDAIHDMGTASGDAADMSANIDIQTLKVLYYEYFKGGDNLKLTVSRFIYFLADDVVGSSSSGAGTLTAKAIDPGMKSQVADMRKFADASALTSPKNISQLAGFLGMKQSQVKQILMYYYIQKGIDTHTKITLPTFVNFLLEDQKKQLNAATKAQLQPLQTFTDKKIITTKMDAASLAKIFGMNETQVQQILYMASEVAPSGGPPDGATPGTSTTPTTPTTPVAPAPTTMSPSDFVNFVLATEPIKQGMTKQEIASLTYLQNIMRITLSGKTFTYKEMASLLSEGQSKSQNSISSSQMKKLFTLYRFEKGNTDSFRLSVQKLLTFMVSDISDISDSQRAELSSALKLTNAVISGKSYSPAEMAALLTEIDSDAGINADMASLLYTYYGSKYDWSPKWRMSIDTLFAFLSDDLLKDSRYTEFINDGFASDTADKEEYKHTDESDSEHGSKSNFRSQIADVRDSLDDGIKQLKSDKYSRLILNTSYTEEGDDTMAFMKKLTATLDGNFATLDGNTPAATAAPPANSTASPDTASYHLIGNTPMAYEMEHTFNNEYNKVSLITALFIFLIVLITFRSFVIPAILILLIQCGVYMTIFVTGIQGFDIYYLAMLIVQGILMGATIDYAILYTSYYRENRVHLDIRQSLQQSYGKSIYTILTSGLILLLATAILGRCFANPAVGQICLSIAKGTACALILILFILPGLLAVFDKLVVRKRASKSSA